MLGVIRRIASDAADCWVHLVFFFCGDHGASGANSGLFLCSSSPQLKGNVVLLGAIVGAWGNPQHCFRCGGLLRMLFSMHLRLIFGLLWGRLRAVISSCY